ncbi:MAG: MJ0042-type zinc finger domain-containing protein, partial [Pseudomonadota bacterium]|nr:MJ0042-type zinc finger domain-containing protein [Pseudomonadota bacterium]
MLFTQVTRCPHCETSFRVGDEQLDAANGYVRCGSCLQVFNATDYFVTDNQTPEQNES